MRHSLRMVAAIGSLGWATMALIPIGCGSGLGPVASCLRVALSSMPIADEPFRQGVETLKSRRQEALA